MTYEIVSGNYEQKFRIDARTGLVSLTAPLTSGGQHGYPVVLTVRAHDQGIPVQSASVPVRVHTQVRIAGWPLPRRCSLVASTLVLLDFTPGR